MFPYLQEVELQAPHGLSNFFPTRKKSDVGAASECELAVALAAVHGGRADEVEYELYDENWFGARPGANSGTAGGWLLQMGLGRARSCGDLRLEIGTAEW